MGRIAAWASYLASLTSHDKFQVERTEDGGEVPSNNFGMALNDAAGTSEESGPYTDDEAGLDDSGTSANPEATMEELAVKQPDTGAV